MKIVTYALHRIFEYWAVECTSSVHSSTNHLFQRIRIAIRPIYPRIEKPRLSVCGGQIRPHTEDWRCDSEKDRGRRGWTGYAMVVEDFHQGAGRGEGVHRHEPFLTFVHLFCLWLGWSLLKRKARLRTWIYRFMNHSRWKE